MRRAAIVLLVLATACTHTPSRTVSTPRPSQEPATSRSGASVPRALRVADFQVSDLSFVSTRHGFALGTGTCSSACTTLLETVDGARHWRLVSRLPAAHVVSLRFVTPQDGYAFGPDLVRTVDGGLTWHVDAGTAVSALEGDSASVLRVTDPDEGCDGSVARLETSLPGSSSWSLLRTLAVHGCPPDLDRQGPDRVDLVSTGAGGAMIWTFSDQGVDVTRRRDVCADDGGHAGAAAAAPGGVLVLVCQGRDTSWVRISQDDSRTYGPRRPVADPGGRVCGLAAASAQRLVVMQGCGPHVTDVAVSQDGGRTWSGNVEFGPSVPTLIGFQDPLTARAIQGSEVVTTEDGGRTWREDRFSEEYVAATSVRP